MYEDERGEVRIDRSRFGFSIPSSTRARRGVVGWINDGKHAHSVLWEVDEHVAGGDWRQSGDARLPPPWSASVDDRTISAREAVEEFTSEVYS